jgi:hypothetical protein
MGFSLDLTVWMKRGVRNMDPLLQIFGFNTTMDEI